MSTTEPERLSRPVALLIGALIGLVALYIGWVFLVEPLLSPTGPVAQSPLPTPTAVPPLPPETPVEIDGQDEDLDALLELEQIEEEQHQIAGARDPFRQVVIEAQVAQPTPGGPTVAPPGPATVSPPATATGGGTTGGATTGGATTGGATTGGGATGGGGTGGGAGTGGTGTGTATDADADGDEMTAGGTELAATGLPTDQLVPLLLSLVLGGSLLLSATRRLA